VYVVARLPSSGRELAAAMRHVLSALADCYVAHARRGHPLPLLANTGIKFRHEPNAGTGIEDWADPWTVLQRGWADCDDLVMYRLVELRLAGQTAHVSVIWQGNGFHVRVRRANGSLEDPALYLLRKNGD
jgi:hypothetical protein